MIHIYNLGKWVLVYMTCPKSQLLSRRFRIYTRYLLTSNLMLIPLYYHCFFSIYNYICGVLYKVFLYPLSHLILQPSPYYCPHFRDRKIAHRS